MGLFKKLFGKKNDKKENEVKAAPKAEAPVEEKKAEVKPEVKAEVKPDAKAEVKPEAKVEEKPAPKAEPKPEKKAEAPAAKAPEVKKEAKAPAAEKKVEEKKAVKEPVAEKKAPANKEAAPEKKAPAAKKPAEKKAEAPKAAPAAEEESVEPAGETKEFSEAYTGCFEIKRSKDDRYVFNLYASNHVIIATSQIYSSAQSALTGIKSVIANAESAPVEDQTVKDYETLTYPKWEIYRDKGDQFRFRLNASNGSCVCHSQGYTSKANCKKGMESIKKSVKNAEIDKAYLQKDEK